MNEIDRAAKRFVLRRVVDYVVDGVNEDIREHYFTREEGEWVRYMVGRRLGVRGFLNPNIEERSGMLQHLILFADAEQVVPREVVEQALKDAKSIGLCAAADDEILIQRSLGAPQLDGVMSMLETFKDNSMFITLSYTNDNDVNAVQPFPIFQDENKVTLVAFIQGDTSVLEKIKKKLTKEFKAAESYDEFWNSIGDSKPDKDGNATNEVPDEIKNLLNADSALVLMNNVGAVWTYEQGSIEKNFDWGSSYGAPEKSDGGKPGVQPADAPKKSFGAVTADPAKDQQPLAAAANTHNVPMARINKQDVSKFPEELRGRVNDSGALVKKSNAEAVTRCPEQIDGRYVDKDMNHRWHAENMHGVVPVNWKDKPLIPASFVSRKVEISVKDLKDTTAANFAKDTAAKIIPSSVISDKDAVKAFNEDFGPKLFGNNAEAIGNPATIRDNEKNMKPIWELLGRKNQQEMAVPRLARIKICVDRPDMAERMWGDEQNEATTFRENALQRIKDLEANVLKLEGELVDAKSKPTKKAFGAVT